MGFADYLSHHPNSQTYGENIDENHVITTTAALHYTLHTTHRKSTNQIARKRKTYNDDIRHSNSNKQSPTLFAIYTILGSRVFSQ